MSDQETPAEQAVEEPQPMVLVHTPSHHLEMEVDPTRDVVVEVAAPAGTIVYEQGVCENGLLDLMFPMPPDEGDTLLRVVYVNDDGSREVVQSGLLS